MNWTEIRDHFPAQWLVVEAMEAHDEGDQRVLDKIAVIEPCPDGQTVFARYRALHRKEPSREFLFVHTGREKLDIRHRRWLGVRLNATRNP